MNLDVVNAMLLEDKEKFMFEALKEAKKSFNKNETPIGAVFPQGECEYADAVAFAFFVVIFWRCLP